MLRVLCLLTLVFTSFPALAALPVVPQPRDMIFQGSPLDLKEAKEITYSPLDNEQVKFSAAQLQKAIKQRTGIDLPLKGINSKRLQVIIRTGKNPDNNAKVVKAYQPEEYMLDISAGATANASDPQGVFYAVQTLIQLIESYGSKLPGCMITDSPVIKHRAVMIDMARLKEKHEYYYELIDYLARYKINTVYLHFSDDGSCALEYKSKPEVTTQYAFSQEEMKKLIAYASDRHVELIPEVESWGHASYILRNEKYAHLREKGNGTLCTLKPGTWEVLDDLYRETAALFPSKYMHIGCDESNFGRCEDCRAFIEKNGKSALVGKHLATACELAKKHGKIPIFWGDVLQLNREAADLIPKDAIVSYWNYKASVSPEPAQFFKSKGFTVIGCPALVWGGRMVLPHGDCLDNISSFSKTVQDEKLMGMSTTVWVPSRYITDSLWYGLAYAADVSWSGARFNREIFGKAFFKQFYGIDATPDLLRQAQAAHYLGLGNSSLFTNLWSYRGQYEKLSKPGLLRYTMPHRDKTRGCATTLRRYQPRIQRHKEEYRAFLLAAEVVEHACERAVSAGPLSKLLEKAKSGDKESLSQAISLLDNMIVRYDELNRQLIEHWDRWRYPDHPAKFGGGSNVLGTFNASGDYIKLIAGKLKEIKAGQSTDWENVLTEPARDVK